MPESAQPLEEKLRTWLEGQGYPLEMRVGQAFQAVGAKVVQSEYSLDPSTEEPREIDVIAWTQKEIDQTLVRITAAIECKSSREKPWVQFVSESTRLADPARVAQRAASRIGRSLLFKLAKDERVQRLPLLQLPARPSYSLTQAFTSGTDICYAAVSGVASAAAALAADADRHFERTKRHFVDIIFPAIVTEARLFDCVMQSSGDLLLEETSWGVLLWRNPMAGPPHTIIHLITTKALPQFAEQFQCSAENLLSLLAGELKGQLQDAQKNTIDFVSKFPAK